MLRPSFCRVDSPFDALGTSLRRCARRSAASTRRSTLWGRRCAAAPIVLPRRPVVRRFRDVAAPLRPSFCRVDSSFDASSLRCVASTRRSTFRRRCSGAAPLHCCAAALLHCCAAALLHCSTDSRQTTNRQTTADKRQTSTAGTDSARRQQTNDMQTNDSRQTTNEHRRERQRAQRAVLSLYDETSER